MTLEELGNFTYGYLGAALGLSLQVLFGGSFYAARFQEVIPKFVRDLINRESDLSRISRELRNEFGDWVFIEKGFNAYRGW